MGTAFDSLESIMPHYQISQVTNDGLHCLVNGLSEVNLCGPKTHHIFVGHMNAEDMGQINDLVHKIDHGICTDVFHIYGAANSILCNLVPLSDSVEKMDRANSEGSSITTTTITCGCMWSGKSTTAVHMVRRLRTMDRPNTLVVNHLSDNRYDGDGITTHDLDHVDSIKSCSLMSLTTGEAYQNASSIVIEEGQFYPDLFPFLKRTQIDGKSTWVFGLDGKADRTPFGQMCLSMTIATSVTKLLAYCHCCQPLLRDAQFTHCRKVLPEDGLLVGGSETYAAVCRKHWVERA